jgi:PPP family 3-phenylpropionic acid transporter
MHDRKDSAMKNKLTFDYAGIQMAYTMMYAGIGAFISVFLLANHFSNTEIGLVMSAANLMTVLLQPSVADFADRTKKFMLTDLILLIAAAVGLFTAFLFFLRGHSILLFVFYVLAMGVHGFLQPLVNSLLFKVEAAGYHLNFGLCRAMGSVGYAAVTGVLGSLIEKFGINMVPAATEISLAMLAGMVLLMSRHYRQALSSTEAKDPAFVRTEQKDDISLTAFIKNNIPFVILNTGVIFLFFHQYIISSFMIQIITPLGGDSAQMGTMFSLSAAIEVPAMIAAGIIGRKFNSRQLLKFSMFGFILKNVLLFLAKSTFLVYVSQCTQMLGYALFYPAMVQYIGESMSRGEAVKGQALFTIMMTIAGVLANLTGGMILDTVGVRMLVLSCLVTVIIGAVIFFVMTDRAWKGNTK